MPYVVSAMDQLRVGILTFTDEESRGKTVDERYGRSTSGLHRFKTTIKKTDFYTPILSALPTQLRNSYRDTVEEVVAFVDRQSLAVKRC
jgi:hypothetical protein